MKRSPLKADPAKIRAMQQRARERAATKARETPRAPLQRRVVDTPRYDGPKRAPKARRAPARPAEGPLTAGAWREKVWHLDGGRCVGCGQAVALDADHWTWQCHHTIAKSRLRREGLHAHVWDPDNGVVTCKRCHERHELAVERIPGARLPARVTRFARRIAPWGVDELNRTHPGSCPAAGTSGTEGGSTAC